MKNEITRVPFHEIEIIELDERLDTAIDPVLGIFRPDLNGICGSNCTGNLYFCGSSCGPGVFCS